MGIWLAMGGKPGDAFTYLAGGQRLNAGHLLYALLPGDNPVLLNPPYWTVPLLSPPLMGAIWRPLALLPMDAGVYLWWFFVIASSSMVMGLLLARVPTLAGAAVLLLSVSLVVQIAVANVDGLLMSGILGVWIFTKREHERAAGAVAALMTALKVTPFIFAWWLLTQGRKQAVVAFLVTGLATLAVSVVGAGIDSHIRFLQIIGETSASGSTPGSLAGLGRLAGVAPETARYFPTLALVLGIGLMLVLRSRPAVTFGIAVLLLVAGSPSVAFHTPALLLTALVPLAWPKQWPKHAVAGASNGGDPQVQAAEGALSS
jgi:Glycosyltransferase family 87